MLKSSAALGAGLWAVIFAAAQPAIPQEQIPPDLEPKLREEIVSLYSKDLVTRANAAMQLGRRGEAGAPAVPFLVGMLGDTQSDTVRTSMGFTIIVMAGQVASESLANLGKTSAPALRVALENENQQVRFMAAHALGLMKDPAGFEILAGLLAGPDAKLSLIAATGLGESRSAESARKLLAAYPGADNALRRAVIEALKNFYDNTEVIGAVLGLMENEKDAGLKEAMGQTLQRLTGEKLGVDAGAWRDWLAKKQARPEPPK